MKFLLCVGAEKAGTTWLYEYFRQHPEFYDNGKELNIIQRDDLVPTFTDSGSYKADLNQYFQSISTLNRPTGDFTHYEGSTENIFRLFKQGLGRYDIDIVPVYIMRDPIQRAWSAWNMLGGSNDFSMPEPGNFLVNNYLSCKYKETVEALQNVFSKPLFFFYEEFFSQQCVDLICNELQISNQLVLDKVINKGKYVNEAPAEFVEKFCLTAKNKRAVDYISKVFGYVPWNIEDFKEVSTESRAQRAFSHRGLFQ